MKDQSSTRIWPLLAIYVAVWTLAHGIASPNLDRYGDMLENFAWGQSLEWGSFKHPPLIAWITGLWFRVLPTGDLFYFLLSFVAAAVGLLGIYQLARAAGLQRHATAAVVLQMCALPYTTLAAKFNANSVLLPLWPWVAYCWWACVANRRSSAFLPLMLGLCAALAMLGKYYSGVLLLSLALLTLFSAQGRLWLLGWRPWLALAVLFAALWPHLHWLAAHDYVTLHYVQEQGEGDVSWLSVFKFLLSPLLYWGIALAVCVAAFGDPQTRWWKRALLAWKPAGRADLLFWMAMLPFLITLLFGLSGFVELSLPWSIPIGFAFPLLWLRNLAGPDGRESAAASSPGPLQRKIFAALMAVVAAGAVVKAAVDAWRGDEVATLPRREAAAILLREWQARSPSVLPAWVGGTWAENAALAFYGNARIRVLPGFPDAFPATMVAAYDPAQPGLIYCPAVARHPDARSDCETKALAWLASHQLPVDKIEFDVARSGWRFPHAKALRYSAFAILPQQPGS